ncbi:fungal-specific transcription factor domain-domain-containing protein [Leucosporidium creatinivorum]|uniref:Fungal-specific transcription factor domain-domain-containing protein n=1 Tax=Leucosporidium creatinivorum TaxID=106004 RepID=A0A1Y2CGZ9_9BASI|nr:fungal-specific transcription factor domain-domain-containing protein [Leucosporidium creatinivorum]
MAPGIGEKGGEETQWRLVQRGGPACDACRRRKTRCVPSAEPEGGPCDYCDSASISCSFAPRVRGPPRSYVEALELRLETTQELLRNLSTSAGVDLVSLAHRPSEPDSSQKLQKAIKALQQTEADRNNVPFGLPPPQQYHPPARRIEGIFEGRFAGKSAGPTLAAQVLDDHCEGATIQVEEQVSLVEHLIGRGEDHVSSASFALPPVELVQLLVDAYFAQLNEQMPVLHRPSFTRALFSGKADSDPAFRSLLFVVLALGTRWVEDPRIRGDWSAEALYAASCCESPVGEHASAGSTLFDLQASTLAVIYLLGAATSVQAWSTGGLAMRKFIDVGAHLETTERWTQSPLVDQLRKRAFHMLFTLDRFCSASLGRPLAIQDFDFDLRHPVAIDDDALDRWESKPLGTPSPAPSQHLSGLFEHLSKVAAVLGRTLHRLYSVRAASLTPLEMHPIVKELTAEHEACLAAVPEHLTWEYSGANSLATLAGRATLRGSSCAAKLAMIRPFILLVARTRDSSLDLLEGAFVLGGHATRTWNNIMRVLLDRDRVHQCFFWIPGSAGYACIVAFHILRSLLVSGRYLLSVTEGLHTAIRALQNLKASTPEAAWAFESCKMLTLHVNRWRAAEKFDYSSFLLSLDPAPIASYLKTPPFCYDDETAAALHHHAVSDLNPHPHEFINLPAEPMNEFSSVAYPYKWDHYPFRKEDWVDLIGDTFPVFSQDLLLGNEQFEWPDEWPALNTQW